LFEKGYTWGKEHDMGITLIEQIGIVAGIVIGVSGFIYSVAQARRQRKRELEQAAREQEQAVREQEQAVREQEQAAFEREQAAKQELRERLYFLANIIVDTDIPRSSRQIFFDEYIAKGGNGSFVKFWYNEGKELDAKKEER
jgi:type II secretory pathway pseudopilin PulG